MMKEVVNFSLWESIDIKLYTKKIRLGAFDTNQYVIKDLRVDKTDRWKENYSWSITRWFFNDHFMKFEEVTMVNEICIKWYVCIKNVLEEQNIIYFNEAVYLKHKEKLEINYIHIKEPVLFL